MNVKNRTITQKITCLIMALAVVLLNPFTILADTDPGLSGSLPNTISIGTSATDNSFSEYPLSTPVERPDLSGGFSGLYQAMMDLGEPDIEYDTRIVGYNPETSTVNVLYYSQETGLHRQGVARVRNGAIEAQWEGRVINGPVRGIYFHQGGGMQGGFPYGIYIKEQSGNSFGSIGTYLVYNQSFGFLPRVGTEFSYDWVIDIPE